LAPILSVGARCAHFVVRRRCIKFGGIAERPNVTSRKCKCAPETERHVRISMQTLHASGIPNIAQRHPVSVMYVLRLLVVVQETVP